MSLHIRSKNFRLTEAVQQRIRLRLAVALTRFHRWGRDATATCADLNGPKGGVDKQCRLVVRLRPNGKVTIEETDSNLLVAIGRAADRLKRTVGRALDRRRDTKIDRNGFSPRQME
jgi:putative sigma-54 modulation protein